MLDKTQARKAFSKFATGVCILLYKEAMQSDGRGLTINSFASVSLDPLLVTFSLKTHSKFFQYFKNAMFFSINVLAENQLDLARSCSVAEGGCIQASKIIDEQWAYLSSSMASFFCFKKDAIEIGDHTLFISDVRDMRCLNGNPLIFFNSQFTTTLDMKGQCVNG